MRKFIIENSYIEEWKAKLIAKQLMLFQQARRYAYKELLNGKSSEEIATEIFFQYISEPQYVYQATLSAQKLLDPITYNRKRYLEYLKDKINKLEEEYNNLINFLRKNRRKYIKLNGWIQRNLNSPESIFIYSTAYIKDRIINKPKNIKLLIKKTGECGRILAYLEWLKQEYSFYSEEIDTFKLNSNCYKPPMSFYQPNIENIRIYYNPEKKNFTYDFKISQDKSNYWIKDILTKFPSDLDKHLLKTYTKYKEKTKISVRNCELIWFDEKIYILFEIPELTDEKEKDKSSCNNVNRNSLIQAATLTVFTISASLVISNTIPHPTFSIESKNPIYDNNVKPVNIVKTIEEDVVIIDSISGKPIEGVKILNETGKILITTNKDGKFKITNEVKNSYLLTLEKEDYKTIILYPEELTLKKSKIELSSLYPNPPLPKPLPTSTPKLVIIPPSVKSSIITHKPSTLTYKPSKRKIYIIKRGDNLYKIAKENFCHYKYWKEIYKLNKKVIKKPNYIYPGQKLIMPDTKKPIEKIETETYIIKKGDTLSKLSRKIYNKPLWRKLYKLNKNILKNPHYIYPGQSLILPKLK